MSLTRRCLALLHQVYARHLCSGASTATCTIVTVKKRKPAKSEKDIATRFVDFKKVRVRGGDGGSGCVSFLSLPCNEWAGPDGGNGGNGGHVIFQADSNVNSLRSVHSILYGDQGEKGRNNDKHGKNARHTCVKVPKGTLIRDEEGRLLADLAEEGDLYVGARGGAGGRGNHYFTSSQNQAPRTYELGGEGEARTLYVELRVMAHFGLVGFPNAGKSTLLRAISRARPKVAPYPFTTLNPHLGIVEYADHQQVAVADIPGLITGAHQNHGLGHSFLRHIERCICLLYVLDLSQDQPWSQLHHLMYELEQYKDGLSHRPCAIVANKLDLPMAENNLKQLRKKVTDMEIYPISAKKKVNIESLLGHIRELYDKHAVD